MSGVTHIKIHRGIEQLAARRAHNPEVGGSSPPPATKPFAQMAESVDALVSNTSRFTPVPVRPRLWVLKRGKLKNFPRFFYSILVTHWSADILGRTLC